MVGDNFAYLQVQEISMKDEQILDLVKQVFTLNVRVSTLEKILIDKGIFTEKDYTNEFNITSKKTLDFLREYLSNNNIEITAENSDESYNNIKNKYN
jgi:transcription initiation factor IIE alpha subunit